MDSTTTSKTAHRRVGVVAVASFLALLLLGALRGPAQADPGVPAVAPTPAPTTHTPGIPDPSFERPRRGGGPGFEPGGGAVPDDGGIPGGGAIPEEDGMLPDPSTDGNIS
jgi:hypothetical protein